MSDFELVPHPDFEGVEPYLLHADCHDGSPFMTIVCSCGAESHVHESTVTGVPIEDEIGTYCPGCFDLLVFSPGQLQAAFAQMREEGWIE